MGETIHAKPWDDEPEGTAPPRGMEESVFAAEINKMVAAGAPEIFAVVAEIGDRVDARVTVWCVKFPDYTEVISDDPGGICGSFQSLENALKILFAHGKFRLVSVAEAQKQAKAA